MGVVSIILPTYNSIRFLKERMDSILCQSFSEWECIVIDGYSTDGTWEYLMQFKKDKRFRYFQFPPRGIYDAWNKGIEQARGSFIYIATSDDTMATDCLEKMWNTIIRYPGCDMGHCCLTIIDENGNETASQWSHWLKVQYFGKRINEYHIRKAPHDGLLHAGWNTVYSSVTQLLIKKDVFEKIGLFSTTFGSFADFEWGLRAGMVCDVIHVPEYLATWRKYEGQATQKNIAIDSKEFFIKLIEMSSAALRTLSRLGYRIPSATVFNQNYYSALYILLLNQKSIRALQYAGRLFFYTPASVIKLFLKRMYVGPLKLVGPYYSPLAHVSRLMKEYKVGLLEKVSEFQPLNS